MQSEEVASATVILKMQAAWNLVKCICDVNAAALEHPAHISLVILQ